MRKKPMIYFAAAIVLGFAIMMVPLALQTGPPTYKPDLTIFPSARTGDTYNGALPLEDSNKIRYIYGLNQPLNLLPFTLILLIGLVVATGVYITFKKRLA